MPSLRRVELDSRLSASGIRARIAEDLRRLADDAGISGRVLVRASGLNASYVARILNSDERPTLETYAKLAAVLGADLSARLYPNTGPTIRDRHQARILEGLLGQLHPRWHPYHEVAVRQPARGWIDAVLHEPRESLAVAVEIQSELRRLEQLIRWSGEKADALPSWQGWRRFADPPPTVTQILLVRRTRATRDVALEFSRHLLAAYPGHHDDAVAALTGVRPWPGPALVWVQLDKDGMRFAIGR